MGSKNSKTRKTIIIDDYDNAMLELKISRDNLHQYQKKHACVIQKHINTAKLLLKKGNKKGAILAIKHKKLQQIALDKSDVTLMNVEQLIISLVHVYLG